MPRRTASSKSLRRRRSKRLSEAILLHRRSVYSKLPLTRTLKSHGIMFTKRGDQYEFDSYDDMERFVNLLPPDYHTLWKAQERYLSCPKERVVYVRIPTPSSSTTLSSFATPSSSSTTLSSFATPSSSTALPNQDPSVVDKQLLRSVLLRMVAETKENLSRLSP